MSSKIEELAQQTVNVVSNNTFTEILSKLGILSLAFVAPIQSMLLSVLFLVFVDTVTGVWAAIKEDHTVSSEKFSRAIPKLFIYILTLLIAVVAHDYLLFGVDFLPIDKFAAGFIGVTELKSTFENMNRISGNNLFAALINKLVKDTKANTKTKKK